MLYIRRLQAREGLMCEHHHFDRRQFGSLVLGAAGLGLLPGAARAAKIKALAVTCIDYRFFNKDTAFVANELNLFKDADNVALAGASLAGMSTKFAKSTAAFWEQLQIAKDLHGIEAVMLIDHMDCGAYKAEFAKPNKPWTPAIERGRHIEVLGIMSRKLRAMRYSVECYLMPQNLAECAERIRV